MKEFVLGAAKRLETAANLVLILSIVGAAFLLAIAFIPVCPPEAITGCRESAKDTYNFPFFFGYALGSLLIAWLLVSFAKAFAAGLRLQLAESTFSAGQGEIDKGETPVSALPAEDVVAKSTKTEEVRSNTVLNAGSKSSLGSRDIPMRFPGDPSRTWEI